MREVLGEEDANVFNAIYGVDGGPNFADPHGGSGVPDKNVLYLSKAIDAKDEDHIASLRAKLKAVRDQRKQPLLDTKIITSWNALMIRALAQGGQVLGEKRYVVERTMSWWTHFRRINLCYERKGEHFQGLHELAACVICANKLRAARAKKFTPAQAA